MTFNLNNSKTIVCDELFLLDTNNTLQNILDLIGGGGGGGSSISAVSPLNLTNNVLTLGAFPSSGINILDSNSTNHIISVNTSSELLLDGNVISGSGGGGGGGSLSFTLPLSESNNVVSTLFKPSTVSSTNGSLQLTANDTAGTLNIQVNPVLQLTDLLFNFQGNVKNLTTSATNLVFDGHDVTTNTYLNTQLATKQDNLNFQVNGVTQNNVTTIDFLYNNANFTNGVLTLSRLTRYDKIPLIYSGTSTIKDLYQGASGVLKWGNDTVAMLSNISNALSFTLPLSESNGTVQTLFKPSTVSSTNTSLQLTANDSTGALNIQVNPTLELINLQFNYQGTIKNLTTSASNLVFDGHDVTTNTYLNTQLATKQDNLTFQINGVTQSNVTTIDFLYNNANFTNGVLTLSRLTQYDKIPFIYSATSTIKDLYQGANGTLKWGASDTVAMLSDIPGPTSFTFTLPLRETSGTVETLFKPSTVSANQGITLSANDSTGSLLLTLDGTESRTALKLEDSGGTVRDLTASVTGAILYNGNVLADITYVQNQLATKQDTISATLPLQISSNTISTLWKPSAVTTGTGSGLSHLSSDSLGTLTLQCTGDEERNQVKLRSPNLTVTEITADNSLNLLWGGTPLALQSWVTSQLVSNYQPKIHFYWTVAPTGNISGSFVDEIYYDTGLNVSYSLNIQTNKSELHIEAEVTQAELNLKQDDLGLTLSNGAITGADKIHLGITNGNSRLHLLGDNTVSTDILHRIELGVGQGDILTVKKFANVGYIGIRQYNPSEALEVNGNIRIETGKLMLMNSTAEGIQSQGHIKLESAGAVQVFSDMATSQDSKISLGNIETVSQQIHNKIALYEGISGATKNRYFRGFGMFQYNSVSNLWGVGIYDNTLSNLPKLYQAQTTGYQDPRFYVTSSGVVTNGTCTATSFPTSSDERLKDNISVVSNHVCEQIFNNIDVKEYNRNDLEDEPFRIGFIAQDVETATSNQSWTNIIHEINKDNEVYKGIDYSRMVCILWGYCKKLETRVKQLERQININS